VLNSLHDQMKRRPRDTTYYVRVNGDKCKRGINYWNWNDLIIVKFVCIRNVNSQNWCTDKEHCVEYNFMRNNGAYYRSQGITGTSANLQKTFRSLYQQPNIGESSLQSCMNVWCNGYTVLFSRTLFMACEGSNLAESNVFSNLFVLFTCLSPIPYIYCYFSIIISGWLSYS